MVTKGAEGNIYLTLAISVGSRKVNRESLQPRSSQSSLKRRNQKQPKLANDQIIKSSLEFSVFILSKLSLQFSQRKEEKRNRAKEPCQKKRDCQRGRNLRTKIFRKEEVSNSKKRITDREELPENQQHLTKGGCWNLSFRCCSML